MVTQGGYTSSRLCRNILSQSTLIAIRIEETKALSIAIMFVQSKKPHTAAIISAGTRTRSLWIRSPARYSIAPQRLGHRHSWKVGLYSPPISVLHSQHPAASAPVFFAIFWQPVGGAVSASAFTHANDDSVVYDFRSRNINRKKVKIIR